MRNADEERAQHVDGVRLIQAALVAALPMELLLRSPVWGLNLPLAVAIAALALMWSTRRDDPARGARALLGVVMVALTSIAAWRAPSMLWLAMVVAFVATAALIALPDARVLWRAEPLGVALRAVRVLAECAAGPLVLATRALGWRRSESTSGARAHLRGLAWSVPVVLPFLLLFAQADPVLGAFVDRLVDVPRLLTHVLLWGALAWLGIGWLATAHLPPRMEPLAGTPVSARDTLWALTALLLVFDVFVALQLRWFFGGHELPRTMSGLTYAEYARSGFFELVVAAALLLGVLLVADWTTRASTSDERRRFRLLAGLLLGFLGVVLASALHRMQLYVSVYGLTQDRFFATAFMLWLALVFVWFAATTLRGRRDRFAGGVYVSGVAAVLLLAAIDPIGRIARFDVERAAQADELDVAYILGMGGDAVPVVVDAFDDAGAAHRCAIAHGLQAWHARATRLDEIHVPDWRAWNRSETRALALVTDALPRLEAACGRPAPDADA